MAQGCDESLESTGYAKDGDRDGRVGDRAWEFIACATGYGATGGAAASRFGDAGNIATVGGALKSACIGSSIRAGACHHAPADARRGSDRT